MDPVVLQLIYIILDIQIIYLFLHLPLRLCKVWLFRWLITLILGILKDIIILLLMLGAMTLLPLLHCFVAIISQNYTLPPHIPLPTTPLFEYGYYRYCYFISIKFSKVHTNIVMFLSRHFPLFIGKEPLYSISPVVSGIVNPLTPLATLGHVDLDIVGKPVIRKLY